MPIHHPPNTTLLKHQILMHDGNTHTVSAVFKMNPPHFPLPLDLHRTHVAHQQSDLPRIAPRTPPNNPTPPVSPPAQTKPQTPPAPHRTTSTRRKLLTKPRFTKPNLPKLPGNTQIKVLAAAIAAGIILPILWSLIQTIT